MQFLESDEAVCKHAKKQYNLWHYMYVFMNNAFFTTSQVPENEVDRMHVRDNLKAVTVSNLW